jgi:phosphotransacetylase
MSTSNKKKLSFEETIEHFELDLKNSVVLHVLVDEDSNAIVELCDSAEDASDALNEEDDNLIWSTILVNKNEADDILDCNINDFAQLAVDLDEINPFNPHEGIDIKSSLMTISINQ